MDLTYSINFECMLYFFQGHDEKSIFKKVQTTLYKEKRIETQSLDLFKQLFFQYVSCDLNGQFYKAMWHIIHTIPLVIDSSKTSFFLNLFLKEFILNIVKCPNCISHYKTTILNNKLLFSSVDKMFEEFVGLHNVINKSRSKLEKNTNLFKNELRKELLLKYPNITLNS